MADEVKIDPALLAALEHYAAGYYNADQPTLYIYQDPKGVQSTWSLERTCGLAEFVLRTERLCYLKLRALQAGLKECGFEDVYERIMREKLG